MLVGFVSDERYIALEDVLLEFESETGSVEARSRATGAVYADVTPGAYRVTLRKNGFGAKSSDIEIRPDAPYQFRLLSNNLVGYIWPKWVRSGEKSEYRVHAVEAYRLDLFRYGWDKEHIRPVGWFDEHGPLATMQVTPDGDYTRTGVEFNKRGYKNNPNHRQYITAPERSGSLLPARQNRVRPILRLSLDRRTGVTTDQDGRAGVEYQLECLQQLWRQEQLHPSDQPATPAHRQCPPRPGSVQERRTHGVHRRRVRPSLFRPPRVVQPHTGRNHDHRPG